MLTPYICGLSFPIDRTPGTHLTWWSHLTGTVEKIENEEHDREHNQEHIVHSTSEVVFLHLSEFPHLLALFVDLLLLEAGFLLLPEEVSITHESAEDKKDVYLYTSISVVTNSKN